MGQHGQRLPSRPWRSSSPAVAPNWWCCTFFWDQPAHAGHTWAQEFLARYCAQPGARMELRSGAAAEHVLKVARAEKADMITLAWSQRLDPGRAPIVRRAIVEAAVPVMLVPIAPG
jgi:hypothetical protein